jgi:ribosomal-protein-alanine N-acetyltransferase
MDEPVILSTRRLLIRTLAGTDAEAIAAFHRRNREHLAPWEPLRDESFFTADHWHAEIPRLLESTRAGTLVPFLLLPPADTHGPVLGRCTLSNVVRGAFQAAHLGFSLDRDAVGRGLMHEALKAVLRYAFEDLGLHRVMANYMPANVRSAALLRRLGFVPEGFARDYLRIAGGWQDHVLTSLVNPRP